jgi:hypothetical protein
MDRKVHIAMVLISEADHLNCVLTPVQTAERTGKMIDMNTRAAIDMGRIFLGQQNDFHLPPFFYPADLYHPAAHMANPIFLTSEH